MKSSLTKRVSVTLSVSEIDLVNRLREILNLRSNTQVVRKALHELMDRIDRRKLQNQFKKASLLVRGVNKRDMAELDALED